MTTEDKLLKLIELADAMYYASQYLTTDASRLHEAVDDYHQFIINEYHKEEPVSKELEDAAEGIIKNIEPDAYHTINQGSLNEREEPAWSEELVLAAIRAGANWKKKQMINSAKKSKIVITSGGILLSDLKIEDFDYADKVKVIIVKENKDE